MKQVPDVDATLNDIDHKLVDIMSAYVAGTMLVPELFAAVRKLNVEFDPLKISGRIDPATGLRYP